MYKLTNQENNQKWTRKELFVKYLPRNLVQVTVLFNTSLHIGISIKIPFHNGMDYICESFGKENTMNILGEDTRKMLQKSAQFLEVNP